MDTKAGKYLTFVLAGGIYGLEILRVREIISMMDITLMPGTPEFVKGLINLRGRIVPVIDTRIYFSLPQVEATDRTCIIVADIGRTGVGFIVDEVVEAVDISADQIEDTPSLAANVDTRFIRGMSSAGGKVTILLDMARVLTGAELAAISDRANDVMGNSEPSNVWRVPGETLLERRSNV